jgi:protease-4
VKKRTVVITVVVVAAFLVFAFFCLVIIMGIMGDSELEFTGFGPKVAVIELYGEIVASKDFVRQVKKWSDDGSVKAIVIHIDSPGGGVAASQEMYDEILKVREDGMIVVASMASVAASGGYYVACATDRIVSNPGTLTGSIGVVMSFPTARKLLEKIGLRWETIKSGDLKDVGNFARPMSPEDERMLTAVIDDVYEQFVEAVAEGRGRPMDEIYPLADGSIFTGRQAYNLGLVDTLGTFEDAIDIAGELAGIGPNPNVVRERKRKPGLWDILRTGVDLIDKVSGIEYQQPGLMYLYE